MKTIVGFSFLMALLVYATFFIKDSQWAQLKSLGSKHSVEVYSGGRLIATFHSTGNLSNEGASDGWYFEDAVTHKLVEVTGTIIVRQE